MDFEWVAIALGDVVWISLAFALGFSARLIGLPPLVGFLVTGFLLNYLGISSGEVLQKLADLGITLLLFTVGLKLDLKMLLRPQVWAVTSLHIGLVIAIFGVVIFSLALAGAPLFAGLDVKLAMMLAFTLSFSSTVFVVKVLEEKGEMRSLHGRIAIGILVMQDVAAVAFLAASTGKLPSLWALLLLLLIPIRPLFHLLLQRAGHGELLILYGLVLALGGAELFELGGVKDDLGALIMGLLISTHPKSAEMAKTLLGFRDLFLVGFFLSIGMAGRLSLEAFVIALLLVPFVFIKSALFYGLMTRFMLRARTSLLVDHMARAEQSTAEAVRAVLGATPETLGDDAALERALNPALNRYRLETLNLGVHSPLTRALHHASYTYLKRLSHTADSQDQRHHCGREFQ